MPVQLPALTYSTRFFSPTPVPYNLGASGQVFTSRDSIRETEKEETEQTELDYEDSIDLAIYHMCNSDSDS